MTTEPDAAQPDANGITGSAEADARRWAFRRLGIEVASQPPSTSELLRRVTEWEYVIPPDAVDAVQLIANPSSLALRPTVIERAGQLGKSHRCREAADLFRQRFFEIPNVERRRHWNGLVAECAGDPRLLAVLDRLKPGLDAIRPNLTTDEHLNHLIAVCCDSFIAHPIQATRIREAFCKAWRRDHGTWDKTTVLAIKKYFEFVGTVGSWIIDAGDPLWRESLRGIRLSKVSSSYVRIAPSLGDTNWPLRIAFAFIAVIVGGLVIFGIVTEITHRARFL